MRCLFLLVSLGLLAPASAQCTVQSIRASNYGSGCSSVFTAPTLAVAFDPAACRMVVTSTAPGGCCNTFLQNHLLMLGVAQLTLPLPQVGPGCNLLLSPDALLVQPNSGGGVFTFDLPPLVVPFTIYAQSAALYFTTIGFTNDLNLSRGAQIALL